MHFDKCMKDNGGDQSSDGSVGLNGERSRNFTDESIEVFFLNYINLEDLQNIQP